MKNNFLSRLLCLVKVDTQEEHYVGKRYDKFMIKRYLDMMNDSIRLIMMNKKQMLDECETLQDKKGKLYNYQWINLTKALRCNIELIAETVDKFTFTYHGKVILSIYIRYGSFHDKLQEDETYDTIVEVYVPEKLNMDYNERNNYKVFRYLKDTGKTSTFNFYNDDYNPSLIYPTLRKCMDILYKKAIVRNSKRLQEIEAANYEIHKQRQIELKRTQEHLIHFAKEYNIISQDIIK